MLCCSNIIVADVKEGTKRNVKIIFFMCIQNAIPLPQTCFLHVSEPKFCCTKSAKKKVYNSKFTSYIYKM